MISCSSNRGKYILTPTVPSGTQTIEYAVNIDNTVVFVGKSGYYGGAYEVDCSDFIESYIARMNERELTLQHLEVLVNFTFDGDPNTVQQMTCVYEPEPWDLPNVGFAQLDPPTARLDLWNCGFGPNHAKVDIKLSVTNGVLDGRTINKMEKVTYIDRYGDVHNGSLVNHYELECYVDPCWLDVKTCDDLNYEKVMLALQNAKTTKLTLYNCDISGMDVDHTYATTRMYGRVKDVERIETYSSYSMDKKVPTMKITFEVYR